MILCLLGSFYLNRHLNKRLIMNYRLWYVLINILLENIYLTHTCNAHEYFVRTSTYIYIARKTPTPHTDFVSFISHYSLSLSLYMYALTYVELYQLCVYNKPITLCYRSHEYSIIACMHICQHNKDGALKTPV